MSRDKRTAQARTQVVGFLQSHPTRQAITAEEFCGGRGPIRGSEPSTPYTGPTLKKPDVSRALMALQTSGFLGRPVWPNGWMYDVAFPKQFPVLRIPEVS